MATTTWTSVYTYSTTANFREWGSRLSAGLAAVGMVQTTDTGQIDWATVAAPTATNTQQGYEIWRFNDALQATAPIYLRIGYGSGSNPNTPSLWFTIGKGSDGAGTITGVLQAAQQAHAQVSSSSTFTSYACSGDGSVLSLCLAQGLMSTTNSLFMIERSRDADGVATAAGVVFFFPNTGVTATGTITRAYAYNSGGVTSLYGFPVGLPIATTANNSLAAAGAAPVYPGTVYGPGFIWQPRGLVVGMRADVGSVGVIAVPPFGTYLSLGVAGQLADVTPGTYATACMVWS